MQGSPWEAELDEILQIDWGWVGLATGGLRFRERGRKYWEKWLNLAGVSRARGNVMQWKLRGIYESNPS